MNARALIPALLVLVGVAAVIAAPDDTKEERAREAFADRDYKTGVTLLNELISEEPESRKNDERTMMVVRGFSLQNDHESATDAGMAFLEKYPESIYRERVAFLTAESLLEIGRGKTGSALMAASLDRMTGPEMRTFIAEVYRKAADRAFAGEKSTGPFDPGVKPDYAKALRLYGRAKVAGIPPAVRYEALLRYAAAAYETKGFRLAIEVLDEAAKSGDPDDPRLLLLKGRALLAAKRLPAARETLERILAVKRDSKEAPEALLLLGLPDDFERLLREYPAHPRAPEAAYRRGDALARQGRLDEAVPALLAAARSYPASPWAPKSVLAAADALFRAKEYDDAQVRYDEYLRRYPESASWATVRGKLTEAWFWRGKSRIDAGNREDAVTIWQALRNTYPLSTYAPLTLSLSAEGLDGEKALAPLRELLTRYPDSKPAPAAALRIGLILAKMPGHMAEAAEALRHATAHYSRTDAGREAGRRLNEMQAASILVELPAPVRPGDRPELVLKTRNLESVNGRVYRIDPEVYFKKHGGFHGIENVMVDVIAPDAKFAHEVPDYEDFREIEGRIEIPVDGEGAWIVTVEGGTLRATGLLLVSGIDMVTKEYPSGAVAFVTDARTGEPVAGARVIPSRNRQSSGRGVTGDDGTTRLNTGHGHSACTYLAVRDGAVALSGFPALARQYRGFRTTVHIATERPVYRPGHTVKYRAVVRERAGSYFRTPAGHEVVISVTDGVGNDLHRVKTRLSDFGTAAGSFTLPEDLPPRSYEIKLRHKRRDYKSDFLVKAYRKPGVFLEVEPDRPVFVRSETVAFAVKVRYSFGRPMPRQPVTVRTWTLLTGEKPTARTDQDLVTDENGVVRVEVPTVAGPDMQIHVRVETTDATRRRYSADAVIPVASTGYHAVLTPDRERAFLGEAVNLTLLTSDLLGEPVAAKGKIRVVSLAKTVGDPIDAVTNDDGKTTVRWTPAVDGTYRFHYEGRDRAGRIVRASANVTVIRTESAVTVRAERPDHRVGDTARVTVTAPGDGGHALITYEGERILGHRVVLLTAGKNEIDVPVESEFVPNLWISATMIHDRRLFTGKDHLEVSEVLTVTVEPEKEEYGPGDVCRLTVTTQDGRGKPTAAEVAVGVVDEALYVLYPDRTPKIAKTFTPPLRKHLVRTKASTEFRWAGKTTTLSEDLLAERDRRKNAKPKKGILLDAEAMEDEIAPFEGPETNATIGLGGGSGGTFGGRGGHRNLRAEGGSARGEGSIAGRKRFEDTAFFKADVVTDENGQAVIEFTLPDDLTEWRITARGASRGNGFGEDRAAFVTKRDLVVRTALPRFLREEDVYTAAVGVVNGTEQDLDVRLTLTSSYDEILAHLPVPAGRERSHDWPLPAASVGEIELTARAAGGTTTAYDAEERKLTVRPYGVAWRTGVAGLSTDGGDRPFALPDDLVDGTLKMTVHVAPTVLRTALDGVVELQRYPYGCTEQTVNRFFPALAVATAIEKLGLDEAAALPRLEKIARAGALRITYLQRKDGLWGWWRKSDANPEMTAYALLALAAAEDAGIPFSKQVMERARAALPKFIERTNDPDHRAFLAYARSRAFEIDFQMLAAPFADRQRLSPRGLAFLALAYEPLGETARRTTLLDEIEDRVTRRMPADTETLGWTLAALAGPDGKPRPIATEVAAAIARAREGKSFGTTRQSGAAVIGIARLASAASGISENAPFTVLLNGVPVLSKRLPAAKAGHVAGGSFKLATGGLTPGLHRISVRGGGVFFYSISVGGVRRKAPEDSSGLSLDRRFSLLPGLSTTVRGKDALVHGSSSRPQPEVDRVRVGELVGVSLRIRNRDGERYVVVEDPLPAGFEMVAGSASGPFVEVLRYDDRVVFFLENPGADATLRYQMRAEGPGKVRTPPAIVYSMYRPANAAWSEERAFSVFGEAAEMERDPALGLSATELWEAARREALVANHELATNYLTALADRFHLTRSGKTKVFRLLADVRRGAGDHAGAVAAWYRLLSEVPGIRLSVADERALAACCRLTGRHGDAVVALTRAAETLIRTDLAVPSDLGDEGRALAVSILDRSPFIDAAEQAWPKLLEKKPADKALMRQFLVRWPASNSAPYVMFHLLKTRLAEEDFEGMERGCRRFADRYPDHALRDDVDWLLAYALFAEERYDEADAVAEGSLGRTYRFEDGKRGKSHFRNNLIHLRAQVAHIKGDIEQAIGLYGQVRGFSADAAAVYAFLTEVRFEVPGVVRVGREEEAAIPIRAKNLRSVTYDLYPIDLLVYFVLTKDTGRMASLNLDGIAAAASGEARFTGTRRESDQRIDLGKMKPGVYLVRMRSGDVERRGVLLVSDLKAEMQHGRRSVRVLVTDRKSGRPAAGARVLVSAQGRLVGQGVTDARGIFEVKASHPGATAVAAWNGQHALAE